MPHSKKAVEEDTMVKYESVIKDLIECLVYCLKSKGMSPFGRIFTYMSSVSWYR